MDLVPDLRMIDTPRLGAHPRDKHRRVSRHMFSHELRPADRIRSDACARQCVGLYAVDCVQLQFLEDSLGSSWLPPGPDDIVPTAATSSNHLLWARIMNGPCQDATRAEGAECSTAQRTEGLACIDHLSRLHADRAPCIIRSITRVWRNIFGACVAAEFQLHNTSYNLLRIKGQ